ncbi:MAG TPA: hypothetical protein VJO33_05155 [Gemmatimonadaceae bacterium]|nr:hypothetical protein [Gemmatimonadaceae bacterium]
MTVPTAPALHTIVEAILIIAVGVKAWLDRRALPRRAHELDTLLTKKLAPIHKQLDELKAYVIGPDGQNGLRGDLRVAEERIDGLEERERRRLEARDIGALQRPT